MMIEHAGIMQPAPAPRFSRTKPTAGKPATAPGHNTRAVLAECGYSSKEIDALETSGVVLGAKAP
jgi:alpha-methylacyl-CoA racemase